MTTPPAPPTPTPSLHAEAARGSAWSILTQLGTQAVTLVVWSVLGWNLAPAEIGLVAFAQLLIAFLMIFLEQGFSDALVRRRELARVDENTIFWTSLSTGLLLAGLVNLIAAPLAAYQGEPRLEAMLRALSLSFPLMAFRVVPEALLVRAMRMRDLTVRTLAATVLSGVAGCLLALRGFGAWSLVAQTLVHLSAGTLLLWWRSGWRPGWSWDSARFWELFRFGAHITGGNVFAYYNRRFDQWMVNAFLGKAALGIYQMAQRWVDLPFALVSQSSSQVALAAFSRVQADRARLARGWVRASSLLMTLGAPLSALLAAAAPELLLVLVGPNWTSVAPVMSVLAAGILFQPLNALSSRAFIAAGRPQFLLIINVVLALTNTVGVLLAAPHGVLWVAVACALRIWLVAPLVLWMMHLLCRPDWREYARMTAGPLLPALVMAVAIRLLLAEASLSGLPVLVRLAVSVLAGGVVYTVLLRILAPGPWAELWLLLRRWLPSRRPGAGAT